MHPIDVTALGAVLLGPSVSCDGFRRDRSIRVQTHLHSDHMGGFDSSKGFQDVLLSRGTYDLLCCEQDADLPHRSNLVPLSPGETFKTDGTLVELFSSGHMLGAVQVAVTLPSGVRLGYSSDFQWPLDEIIRVDALVVDSTYGNPESVRNYSQGECEEQLVELVRHLLRDGPVHLIAHRGTLERAIQLLSGEIDHPLVGTERICSQADIYREHGYAIDPILNVRSDAGQTALRGGPYIRLYGTGDDRPVDITLGATVKLSAYFTRPDAPVVEYSPRSYGVALSGHADFAGTVEYVAATGAEYVVTDNSRGGNAVKLAIELRSRLGVEAIPSKNRHTRAWGD